MLLKINFIPMFKAYHIGFLSTLLNKMKKAQALEDRLVTMKKSRSQQLTQGSYDFTYKFEVFTDPSIKIRTMYKTLIGKSGISQISD
jgi:hypothetical protein